MNDIMLPPNSDLDPEYSVPNPISDDMDEMLKDAKIIYMHGPLEYFEPLVQLMRVEGWMITEIGGVTMEETGGVTIWGEEPRAMNITVHPKQHRISAETFYMCRYGHYDPVFVLTQTDQWRKIRHTVIVASVVEAIPLRDLVKRLEASLKLLPPDA